MLTLAYALGLTYTVAVAVGDVSTTDSSDHSETLAPLRADLEPRKFRLRTGRVFAGARWRPVISVVPGSSADRPCGLNHLCGVSPQLGFDLELGTRTSRLLVGAYTAPMPWLAGGADVVSGEFLVFEVGALFGTPKIRAGVSARVGALLPISGTAILRVTPWVGRRGGRHGFELRAGLGLNEDLNVGLGYTWHPPLFERARLR